MIMPPLQRAGGRSYGRIAVVAGALLVAAGALTAPSAATADNTAKITLAQAIKRTLLLFPFDVPASSVGNADEVSQMLTDVAASKIAASGQYSVMQFHKTLPQVARAHLDQELTDSDVAPPFADDNIKAPKIAKVAGYDLVFTGAIDEYSYNQADNSVDLVVRGQIYDVKANKPLVPAVVLKASSTKGGAAKEPQKAVEAAREAATQLMAKLVPATATAVPQPVTPAPTRQKNPPSTHKHSNNTSWILGALAVGLGLAIGLSSSGHGGGGGAGGNNGGDTPPPPP